MVEAKCLFLKNVKRILKTSSCQKREIYTGRFFGQNKRFVETKRKKKDSTPEIWHKVLLIFSSTDCRCRFWSAGGRSKEVTWGRFPCQSLRGARF